MKHFNKIKGALNPFWIISSLLLFLVVGLSTNTANTEALAFDDAASFSIERYAFPTGVTAVDTLNDAENITLLIPTNLFSLWSYNWSIEVVSVSGTVSIIGIVQEKNHYSDDNWYEVERDTISAAGTMVLNGTRAGLVLGQNQRVILDGSGTQASQYKAFVTLKK